MVWLCSLVVGLILLSSARLSAQESVRLWGELSASYQLARTDVSEGENDKGNRRLLQGSLSAVAPIWRSWVGVADASLQLNQTSSEFDLGQDSKTLFGTGNAGLNLFPDSNFPFLAFLNVTDSRAETDLQIDDFRYTRSGLEQRYFKEDGSATYLGRFEHLDYDANVDGTRDELQFDMSHYWASHQLQVTATGVQQNDADDNSIEDYFLVGRHSVRGNTNFSLENMLTATDSKNDVNDNRRSLLTTQLSSFLSWRPETDNRLLILGSLRGLLLESESESESERDGQKTGQSDLENMSMTAGADYQMTPTINVFGSVSGGQNRADDNSSTFNEETVGINYASFSLPLGEMTYNWGSGATIGHVANDQASDVRKGLNFNQGISRGAVFSGGRSLNFSLNQRLNYEHTKLFDEEYRMNHSLTLRGYLFDQTQLLFTFTDDRREGREEDETQLFNLQLNTTRSTNRDSFFSGNLTLQGGRSKTTLDGRLIAESDSIGTTESFEDKYVYATAQVSYQHRRPFRVRNLRLFTELRAASNSLVDRENDNQLGFNAREKARWRLDVDYYVGLLQIKFITQVVKYDERMNSSVEIKITRNLNFL